MFMVDFWGTIFLAIIFGFSFIFFDNPFSYLTWQVFGLIVLRAFAGVIVFVCYLQAIKHLPLSVIRPLTLIKIFPLIILGDIIFGDAVTITVLVIAIVIFTAGFLLGIFSNERKNKDASTTRRQYTISLVWFAFFVLCNIGTNLLTRHIGGIGVNVFTFALIFTTISLVIETIILVATKQSPLRVLKENWNDKILFGASIGDSFWLLFFVPLSLAMNLGLVDAIMVSAIALAVVASRLFLKEKIRIESYILIAIILGGAIAIGILY